MTSELTDLELWERLESVNLSNEVLAAYPELLNHRGILGRYYDLETLARSLLARRLFLLPGNEQLASAGQGLR